MLPLPPPAVALLRRACSWSNSKSSRRWVKASFCWIAIRNKEFRVFFSSSAAISCLCMSSSWITYSSHLRGGEGDVEKRERGGDKKKPERNIISSRWSSLPFIHCCSHMGSPFPRQQFPDGRMRFLLAHSHSITSDFSHNALCLIHTNMKYLTFSFFIFRRNMLKLVKN